MTTNSNGPDEDVKQLEELVEKVADEEAAVAERHVASLDGQRALREIQQHSDDVIAQARRRALDAAAASAAGVSSSIPQRILAMTREVILARLEELCARFGGELAVQFRDLEGQSIEDLRSLLADIESGLHDTGEDE